MSQPAQQINSELWSHAQAAKLDKDSILDLFSFRIPAILVKGFLAPQYCERITHKLRLKEMGGYAHTSQTAVFKLGLSHMEHFLKSEEAAYFSKVPQMEAEFREIFDGICENPTQLLTQEFRALGFSAENAADPAGKYFAGGFRRIDGHVPPHFDYHALEAKNCLPAKSLAQLSWNLYLSTPRAGGELIVHELLGGPDVEHLKMGSTPYYDLSSRNDVRRYQYEPSVGDLVLFNSRCFHEVLPSEAGTRFTQSSFIGLLDNDRVIFWS